MMVRGFRDLGVKLDSPSPSRITHIEGQRMSQTSIDFLTFLVWNVDARKVLQNPKLIELLAGSIIKKDCPSFSFVQVEFSGNDSYFVLYMAQSCAILLEIQSNLTKNSMKQSVEKCLEVFYRFDIQPLLVILCTDKISSSVRLLLLPTLENSHRQMFNSTVWAEKCLIILKDAINLSEDESNKLDPLAVFAIYFFR
ncbi:uncharacterized protein BX663DRAFT_487747 [Cokeromyces recurvatus]|uniref:uncharacterized protein n=1 Tax=Cokeromyces recurvatus TaxID=90255 RepID=UPI00221F7C6D|nr:uncharacterized protein BX663DRAFT_487747 [Cokeromyces recurvatus]KAI7901158.1 hypothetical protein BX663DRAFT_487747 [Cokeromyces recurvatus]